MLELSKSLVVPTLSEAPDPIVEFGNVNCDTLFIETVTGDAGDVFPSLADSELVGVYQRDQPHWLDNLIWLYRFRRILEFPRWWCFLL